MVNWQPRVFYKTNYKFKIKGEPGRIDVTSRLHYKLENLEKSIESNVEKRRPINNLLSFINENPKFGTFLEILESNGIKFIDIITQ